MTIPFSERRVARAGDGRTVIVGPVAGNIDDAPQSPIRALVEQRHREIDRARDRGARRPADRRLHDLVGDGVRGFRTVDQPPGNDDLLVARRRPFEIGHRDPAVWQALQRLQKFLRHDGLRVAFALDRKFIHVHGVGDIDGEDQFDIDGRQSLIVGRSRRQSYRELRRQLSLRIEFGVRRGEPRDVASGHCAGDKHRPDRDIPAHCCPPVDLRGW